MSRDKIGEIKRFENTKERNRQEELADLFSIIRVTEALETAFSRDAITSSEYTEACTKLISQFKTTESALVSSKAIVSADAFFFEYQIDCPRAKERLLVAGAPATVVHAAHDDRQDTVIVAQTTQAFITAMDALKLEQRAVDQVQPLISDLMGSLNRIQGLPVDFEGLVKIRLWLKKLNQMRAADEIGEEEARQLLFDLESSYGGFMEHLSGKPRK